jgi:hypothetical protein
MTTSAKSLLGLAWGLLGLTWVLRNTDVDGVCRKVEGRVVPSRATPPLYFLGA